MTEDLLNGLVTLSLFAYIFTSLFIHVHFFVAFLFLYGIIALITIEVQG